MPPYTDNSEKAPCPICTQLFQKSFQIGKKPSYLTDTMWKTNEKLFQSGKKACLFGVYPLHERRKRESTCRKFRLVQPIRKRRKQPCKNRLSICLARASHRHRQSEDPTTNRNKEWETNKNRCVLIPTARLVFHSRQSNLKGGKNAIELFEKRKDNRPWGTHRRQKIYRCQSLCRQEGFQKNHLRLRFQTNASRNGSPDRLTARAAWCFVCFAV